MSAGTWRKEDGRARGVPSEALLLWAAALAARLAFAAASGRLRGWHAEPFYDDGAYRDMALSFLGRSPSLWITHPPGYSALLAPFLLLGDRWGVLLARLAQLALGAAAAPLCRRLSLDMGLSRAAALWAGGIAAAHPMLIYFSPRLLPETAFSILALCFFLAWGRAWSSGRLRLAALAGALGGFSSLLRGVMLPFGAVLALVALLCRRRFPRWAALVAVCGLAWVAALSPWILRNWLRFGRFVPVSAQGGWNLYEGLTLDLLEIERLRPVAMGREAESLGLSDPFARDAHFGRKARDWMREHPMEFLRLAARKALRFWRPFPYPPHPPWERLGFGLFSLALFGLAAAGLRPLRGLALAPFLLGWAAHLTLLHSVFAGNLRYRLPLEPFLAVAAGAGLASLLSGKSDRIAP